ncbi:MAG: DUF6585 family protein [Polyangiaceae bacterium]
MSARPAFLGKHLSTHHAPRFLKVAALLGGPLLLLLGLVAFVGALDPDPKEPLAARIGLTLVGACFAGLGAAVLLVWWRKQATLVELYEGGIVALVGSERRELAWGDVLSFQRSTLTSALYRLSVLIFELRDGGQLNFTSQRPDDVEVIANRLEREITAQSLPRLRQILQSGRALSFGKVSASLLGVHHRKRLIPWEEVAAAQVRRGFLEVLKHGDAAPTLRVHVSRLRRVDALLALVNDQRQRTELSPPFTDSPAFRRVRRKLWLQSLLAGTLVAVFCVSGGDSLYLALRALDMTRSVLVQEAGPYFVWAVVSSCVAVVLGLGWWHEVRLRLRRQRLAQRLAATGKLVPVLVLEKSTDEWSFHSGWRYRYLTPGGFEATDKLDVGSGVAEPWRSGSDYLLALCSPDERESLLFSASGYPLARLPATPDTL